MMKPTGRAVYKANIRLAASAVALGIAMLSTSALAQTDDTDGQATPDASASAPATPQASVPVPGEQSQDIVVTGIRASLASAAALKRNADIVQDSITQEDLGKFPDANVAESLQRIPGVSIDRNNGEGQFVSVRGLGPQFNTVLVNGRSLASDNYGREFSFDLLAAELISGADVYKTSLAQFQDGGIGATINLHTLRPFDLHGFKGIVTLKGNYEQNNKDVTPQAFGLLSDTFDDGRFGLLASLSYQKRIASINSVTSDGYLPHVNVGPADDPIYSDVTASQNINVNNSRDVRTRLGATLVGQFKPTEDLVFTLDGLYNKFKSDADNHSLGLWFEPSQYTAATIDDNRTVTSLTTNGNADMINSSGVRDTTTYEVGFNTDWHPSDQMHIVLDATTSRAKNAGAGKSFFTVTGVPTTYSYAAPEGNGLPTISGFSPDALTDPSLARTHLAQRAGNDVSERVYELKLDTEWKSDGGLLDAIRFGLDYSSRRRVNTSASTFGVSNFYGGYITATDPSLLSPFTVGSIGSGGDVPHTFFQYDPNAYLAFLASPEELAARDVALGLPAGTSAADFADQSDGHGYDAVRNPSDSVQEQVYSSYVAADFKGDVAGVPWFLNIGGRYVYTELKSHSQQRALLDLLSVPGDPTIYNAVFQNDGEYVPVDARDSYSEFLPEFNLKFNLGRTVVFRLAGSKTLTRPELNDLRPVTSYDVTRPASLQASGGNADLKPYKSTNFDASMEWYPTRTTTLSAAVFFKHIDDFIVTTIENEVVPIANESGLPVGGFITGPNEATFATARPRNADAANVRGIELSAVHTFDWLPGFLSGFGTQLNATFVKTNRTFANVSPEERFAVVGLSNSQNATLFYEKYGISARITYNHRDRFLSSIAQGYGSEPLFVRGYGQFDANISYDVTRNAQIFVEGTNIFNAKYMTEACYSNELRAYDNYGSRFDAGVRFKF
ncbi:TonB-dependent receptor [Sphingomonas koreensis]|nr:TonB-dependent receptor [Sphingomonas koreensis]